MTVVPGFGEFTTDDYLNVTISRGMVTHHTSGFFDSFNKEANCLILVSSKLEKELRINVSDILLITIVPEVNSTDKDTLYLDTHSKGETKTPYLWKKPHIPIIPLEPEKEVQKIEIYCADSKLDSDSYIGLVADTLD